MSESPTGGEAKRRRMPTSVLLFEEDFSSDDNSSDSSYRPDNGELQEFRSWTQAKVTELIEFVRDDRLGLGDFSNKLVDRIESTPPNSHEFLITELRFAMANCIQLKKMNHLEILLSHCPPHLLPDVFSGFYRLVNFSIKIGSVEALLLLLNHGADKVNNFSVNALEAVLTAIDDAVDNAFFNEVTAKTYLEITKLLFSHEINVTKYPHLTHELAVISGRSVEMGRFLLQNIPGECYQSPRINNIPMTSPLYKAFESMTSWVPNDVLENGFRCGILEMVKLGAPLFPNSERFLSKPGSAINLVNLERKARMCNIKQPFALTRLIIEARQVSSFNFAAFSKQNSLIDDANQIEYAESDSSASDNEVDGHQTEVDKIAQFLKSQFPRRLQNICRSEILKTLPIGPERSKSVRSLEIPRSLTQFLLYDDLIV